MSQKSRNPHFQEKNNACGMYHRQKKAFKYIPTQFPHENIHFISKSTQIDKTHAKTYVFCSCLGAGEVLIWTVWSMPDGPRLFVWTVRNMAAGPTLFTWSVRASRYPGERTRTDRQDTQAEVTPVPPARQFHQSMPHIRPHIQGTLQGFEIEGFKDFSRHFSKWCNIFQKS